MFDPAAREKYEGTVPASWLDGDLEIAEAGGKRPEKLFAGADERLDALMARRGDPKACRRFARRVSPARFCPTRGGCMAGLGRLS